MVGARSKALMHPESGIIKRKFLLARARQCQLVPDTYEVSLVFAVAYMLFDACSCQSAPDLTYSHSIVAGGLPEMS